jgi:hypothetical protein
MNADGSRPVVADLGAGVTAPLLRAVWTGRYAAAGLSLVAGALLVALAVPRSTNRVPPADEEGRTVNLDCGHRW